MITLSHCYVSKNKTQKMLRGSRFTLQKNTTRSHEHQCSLLPDIQEINKHTETGYFTLISNDPVSSSLLFWGRKKN